MAINMVEMQGMVPRQHDFQIQKHQEDAKVLVDQSNYQLQGEKTLEQNLNRVNKQENAELSQEDKDRNNKDAYQGDGGRRRKKQQEDGIVVKKKPGGGFDMSV